MRKILGFAACVAMIAVLSGCKDRTPAEKANDAAKDVGNALQNVVDKAKDATGNGDTLHNAVEAVEKTVEKAADAVKEAADKAVNAVKEAVE